MLPHHFSPSSLTLYVQCPAAFKARYIDGIHEPTNLDMAFGKAVHAGLEAHFLGADGDTAFLAAWSIQQAEVRATGAAIPPGLSRTGLDLIAAVQRLGLSGEPEKKITVRLPDCAPIIGVVDLWNTETNTIIDFKTARVPWAAGRADKALWQPALYSLAYQQATGRDPTFQFVVLPRDGGRVQLLDATRSVKQIAQAMQRFWRIVEDLEHDRFDCTCKEHRGIVWSPGFDLEQAA